MNGEGTSGENSNNTGKDSSEGNHSEECRSEGNNEDKESGATDKNPPTKEGGSSSGSGGDDDKPPSKADKNHVVEDEMEEEDDDDNDPEEDHKPSKEELNIYGKGNENVNGDTKDVKLNIADHTEAGFDPPKPKRGRPVGSGRGRRGRKKSLNIGNRDSLVKGPRKQRKRREFTPSEMVRREPKIKEEKKETEDKIALARKKYLMSIAVKEEDTSSWDKEVASTLKSVIQKSKRSKKYRAVGRPRKRPLEDDDGCGRKIKKEVTAYPIIEVKKGNENDWNAEAKYTIPGFCCNDCGAVYQSTAALRRHQNYECGKEPQFKCNECDYAAKHKGTLKSHIKNRHLPKGVLEETPKKPRKPRRPRITFIPPPVPSPS